MLLSEIKLNPKNPRLIKDERFKKLCQSIKDFPEMMKLRPMVVDDDGVILGGNMRYKALQELGYTEIPNEWVVKASDLTEEKKKEFIIKDNVGFGENDWDMLANEWDAELLDKWGLEVPKGFNEAEIEEDEAPEVSEEEPKSKLGEIYQLGKHRVMCGDSTDAGNVALLMNGENADMVFTDPPYNIGFGYKKYDDEKSKEDYAEFCSKWFEIFSEYPLIFTPGPRNAHFYPEPKDIGTWVKKGGKTGASVFFLRYCEPILFFGDFKKKRNTDLFEHNSGDFRALNSSGLSSGVDIKKKNREYAPAKPVVLIADILNSFSEKDNLVVDCFSGNGTTLIACEQTNRKCYGLELDERYVDVIRRRYAKFIGKEEEWEQITPKIN